MKKIVYIAIFAILSGNCFQMKEQKKGSIEENVILKTNTGNIEGTLRIPEVDKKGAVVLIIAGSGPTDRNGNQPMMVNNSLKFLAEALGKNGIASLSYDKRGVGKSQSAGMEEEKLTFDNFVKDAEDWVNLLKRDKRFSEVIVLGHSEGGLIGLIAASKNANVSKLISVAGAGKKIGVILREQLSGFDGIDQTTISNYIDRLEQGERLTSVDPNLYSIFRPSVQPFMISWLKHDPAKIIAELKIPVLIVQGDYDIQVSEDNADILAQANPSAKKVIVKGMNHVLKNAANRDLEAQTALYLNPHLPVNEEMIDAIVDFVRR